jgi:hypothetical protein
MADPTRNLSYNITIQCALDGFCFLLHDQEMNRVVDLELYQTSETDEGSTIAEAIGKSLFRKDLYQKPLRSARFIVDNRFCTLVPLDLFDEELAASYFLFNHEPRPGYTLRHETIPSLQAVNVYAVPTWQEQQLGKLWNNMQTVHRSSIFLNSVLLENPGDNSVNAYVNVNSRSFDLAIVQDQQLAFFNNFSFNTKDDFVFFLLSAFERQHIGSDTPVRFSGLISAHSEIIQLCQRYLKHLYFVRPDGKIEVDMKLNDTPYHYYYIPYKSLLCAL